MNDRTKFNYNRNFTLLLYPEDENHMKGLEYIKKSFDYAMICHNKDVTEDGELKKEHIHCVIRVGTNPRWRTAVAEEIGIGLQSIEGCNLDKQLRYLIHFDNKEKYQYDIEDVQGNLKGRLKEIISRDSKTEAERVTEVIEFIESQDRRLNITDFSMWASQNGYWDIVKKSQNIFMRMIEFKNSRF